MDAGLLTDPRRYASYNVDVAKYGPAMRSRYGVTSDADHAHLEHHWAIRFETDPQSIIAFEEAKQAYLAWLLDH